jgi:hypothetical protein
MFRNRASGSFQVFPPWAASWKYSERKTNQLRMLLKTGESQKEENAPARR